MAVLLSSGSLPSTRTKRPPMLFQDAVIEGNSTAKFLLFTGEFSKQSLLPRNTLFSGMRKKSGENIRFSFIALSAKSKHTIQETLKDNWKNLRKAGGKPILSEGRDEDESCGQICPGCGVYMQEEDPNLPGYYQKRKLIQTEIPEHQEDVEGLWADELDSEDDDAVDDIDSKFEGSEGEESNLKSEDGDEFDWDSDEWELELGAEDDDLDLDGFAPAGVGYGNITEETIKKGKKKRVSKSEKKRMAREAEKEREEVTVCARCHSLRNYGQVKHQTAANLIPDFDFDRLIATRLMKPTGSADATVVVMVVDCVDFDGSFPKRAAKSLFKALEGSSVGGKVGRKLPKLVLVATKVDLLPSQISPTRLDRWVRNRAKAGGAPKLSGVYLVSARKDLGIRNLLSFIKELAGPRGNVWVIGAQNAGKSTLINTFAKREGVKITKLTEAAVPGTTLGILRIGGILSAKAKMYDTPGLLHPYLMSMRLNRDEQKLVEIRKELQPRTYRMKVCCVLLWLLPCWDQIFPYR